MAGWIKCVPGVQLCLWGGQYCPQPPFEAACSIASPTPILSVSKGAATLCHRSRHWQPLLIDQVNKGAWVPRCLQITAHAPNSNLVVITQQTLSEVAGRCSFIVALKSGVDP
jgi:hypothetical protein